MMKRGLMATLNRSIVSIAVLGLAVSAQATEIALRLGQGGFRDRRAPDGGVGGSQVCLDVKLNDLPIVVSIGQESYTKGPVATATGVYEIKSLATCNVFFTKVLSEKWPTNLYLGGGVGRLKIPQGNKAAAIQGVGRIDTKLFWKISGYVEGKYIYSNRGLIDFSEAALLFGICFKFEL
jgi:hypothetical protein